MTSRNVFLAIDTVTYWAIDREVQKFCATNVRHFPFLRLTARRHVPVSLRHFVHRQLLVSKIDDAVANAVTRYVLGKIARLFFSLNTAL